MNHRIDTFTDLKNALKPQILQIIDDFGGGIWTKGWNVNTKTEYTALNSHILFRKLADKADDIHKNITINLVNQLKKILESKHLDQIKRHPLNCNSDFYSTYEVVLANTYLTIIDFLNLPTNLIDDYHKVLNTILLEETQKARYKLKNADQKTIDALNKNIGQLHQKRTAIYQQICQRYDKIDLENLGQF